jgi:hypothetical protein
MKGKDQKGDQAAKVGNPWGHCRAKLVWRGETIVLGGPSNDTVGDIQSDYQPLFWSLRQLSQYAAQKRAKKAEPTLADVKRDFGRDRILLGDSTGPGYATDSDLEEFLKTNPAPSKFAKELMARRWELALSTIETDLKPHRKKK